MCLRRPARLAAKLCSLAGGRLEKAYFCSSGSEGVETAIKFARAFTGRDGLIAARGAFHGLTCGALSLMDNGFWSDGFGPLLPGVEFVDFGNLEQMEKLLATRRFAALMLEPVQGEGGIVVPADDYLPEGSGTVPQVWDALRSGRSSNRPVSHGTFSGGAPLWA